jgi:hypothetical protein
MTDKIESLISQVVQGKSADAEASFNQIISQKASEAIDRLRGDLTDRMFNQGRYNESVISEGGGGIASLQNAPAAAKKLGLDKIPGTSTVRTKGPDGKVITTTTKTDANGNKTVTKEDTEYDTFELQCESHEWTSALGPVSKNHKPMVGFTTHKKIQHHVFNADGNHIATISTNAFKTQKTAHDHLVNKHPDAKSGVRIETGMYSHTY